MPERSRVDLPAYVPERYEEFVGGIKQERGVDYEVLGRSLVFPRPIAQEGRLGFWRWLSMFLGIAGTYRQNDSVDVIYTRAGSRVVASGLPMDLE
jgi:hypothetical protein